MDIEGLNERGREVLDSKPMALPLRFSRPPSLQEQIKALVRTELSRSAQDAGYETWEESDDFDIPDDPIDPHSPWELSADQEHFVEEAPVPSAAPQQVSENLDPQPSAADEQA